MGRERLQTIHPYMRSLMIKHGCDSLYQLAAKLDIPQMTLSKWNSKLTKRPGHIDELANMCTRFGVTPEEWLSGWLEVDDNKRKAKV